MKTPTIINKEYTEDGASYCIQWPCGMKLWFDVWQDDNGDTNGDWNKYIFFTDNEQDMREKAFQDANNAEVGAYNFSEAYDIASAQYEDDLQALTK